MLHLSKLLLKVAGAFAIFVDQPKIDLLALGGVQIFGSGLGVKAR